MLDFISFSDYIKPIWRVCVCVYSWAAAANSIVQKLLLLYMVCEMHIAHKTTNMAVFIFL